MSLDDTAQEDDKGLISRVNGLFSGFITSSATTDYLAHDAIAPYQVRQENGIVSYYEFGKKVRDFEFGVWFELEVLCGESAFNRSYNGVFDLSGGPIELRGPLHENHLILHFKAEIKDVKAIVSMSSFRTKLVVKHCDSPSFFNTEVHLFPARWLIDDLRSCMEFNPPPKPGREGEMSKRECEEYFKSIEGLWQKGQMSAYQSYGLNVTLTE